MQSVRIFHTETKKINIADTKIFKIPISVDQYSIYCGVKPFNNQTNRIKTVVFTTHKKEHPFHKTK